MGVCQLGVAALVYNWTLYALPVTASGRYGGEIWINTWFSRLARLVPLGEMIGALVLASKEAQVKLSSAPNSSTKSG